MRTKYHALWEIDKTIKVHEQARLLRQAYISKIIGFTKVAGFKKLAFDTRYFDSELDVNPRRNLQNYHSSTQQISESFSKKLGLVKKVYAVSENIKSEYQRQPEYQDSYARILNRLLERSLRILEKDANYSESQPSLTSIAYLEDLLQIRYKLSMDEIAQTSDNNIKNKILNIDTDLLRLDPMKEKSVEKTGTQDYNDLFTKLMSAPSDKDITLTIQVKGNKEKSEIEKKPDFKDIVSQITNQIDPLINEKLKNTIKELEDTVAEYKEKIKALNKTESGPEEDPEEDSIEALTNDEYESDLFDEDDDDEKLLAHLQSLDRVE